MGENLSQISLFRYLFIYMRLLVKGGDPCGDYSKATTIQSVAFIRGNTVAMCVSKCNTTIHTKKKVFKVLIRKWYITIIVSKTAWYKWTQVDKDDSY